MLVLNSETLARFVMRKEWVRKADNTIKQDAFIPPKDLELSVTRHTGITNDELLKIGQDVAAERTEALFGRADILASVVRKNSLDVVPAPIITNRNHAHIVGWSAEKAAQKMIALELAEKSTFVPV
jgi:hypothetical protein